MKSPFRPRLTRRDLMQTLGGAALALPMLELFQPRRARAAGKKSKYAVFCYTPNGVHMGAFWPKPTSETDFRLSPILTPFQAFKDRLLVFSPQMVNGAPKDGTGLIYTGYPGGFSEDGPPQHHAPVTLTARGGRLGYHDQIDRVNKLDGPSIDQVIAEAVQAGSLFGSLNFGLHPVGGDTPSDINFAKDGSPLKRMASADEAWNRIFAMPIMGGNATAAEFVAREGRKRAAVTDFLHARFAALKGTVSMGDRRSIDQHLDALRIYEDRKQRMAAATSGGLNQCTSAKKDTVPTDATPVRTGADTEKLSPFFMDLIAGAFSCNLTKVASVTFGYPGGGAEGGLRMPWLGFSDPLHSVSHHGGNPNTLEKYRLMNTWIASQVAGLAQKLDSVMTPEGSLLDQTTIYWFNRHGEGNAHSNWALPNVIIGGTGGYFKMGRVLQLPPTSVTKVLIAIANAMGVDVPTFGKGPFMDTSPLAGLGA